MGGPQPPGDHRCRQPVSGRTSSYRPSGSGTLGNLALHTLSVQPGLCWGFGDTNLRFRALKWAVTGARIDLGPRHKLSWVPMTKRAFYSDSISSFIEHTADTIIGRLVQASSFSV